MQPAINEDGCVINLAALEDALSELSEGEDYDDIDFEEDEMEALPTAWNVGLPGTGGASAAGSSTQHAGSISSSVYSAADLTSFEEAVQGGASTAELEELGFSARQVKYLTSALGLQGVALAARREELPSLEEVHRLRSIDSAPAFVERLGRMHDVSESTMRRHLEHIGYDPLPATEAEVLDALAFMRQKIHNRSLGITFADARLRCMGVFARPALIRRCLHIIDPTGAKQVQPTLRPYTLAHTHTHTHTATTMQHS